MGETGIFRVSRPARVRVLAEILICGVAALFVALLAVDLRADAQEYPISTGSLGASNSSGSPTSAQPGETWKLFGGGFQPGAIVTLTIESTPRVLGTAVADGSGSFSADVVIPVDLAAGTHTLKASGAAPSGGVLVLSRSVLIGSPSPVALPVTGVQFAGIIALAGALTAGGTSLLVMRRRRASHRVA